MFKIEMRVFSSVLTSPIGDVHGPGLALIPRLPDQQAE
jgi:hypothetical protein